MNIFQRNYIQARALFATLQDEMRRRALPLDVQVDAGQITEDEWAEAYERLEEELGIGEARYLRLEARNALIDWGRSHLDTLWPQFAHLFPGGSETLIRRVFETPRAADRLAEMLLRLGGHLPLPAKTDVISVRLDTDAIPQYTSEQWARGHRPYLVRSRSGCFEPVTMLVEVLTHP